ncbi:MULTISPECIES: type II secretion system protein [unclassified Fibrobacter]|uniref:type IV pilus modification PilV family protein n=1 Tax=unclassified Fibrobacter TaxID=2634177 RepID=UPI000D6B5788|nr:MULTISPECIES: type II secretion system protein [unclassified Fibrobacter]PWJ59766.1 hypothetical protein BGX12_1397 [Fibrobacter sp. UWR4]PZW68032.1 hypothetical protein C8E88_10218 [Fibrobacter sp. UWR1]
MWRNILNIFSRQGSSCKGGFGIMEVMVSIVVLGFLYMALLKLQASNDETVLRLRCRDGAVQVAQEIMDSLKAKGSASIASSNDAETQIQLDERVRTWDRALGGATTVKYTPILTVAKTEDYMVQSGSNYETVQHIYAKQVNVKVEWRFKGSNQSINVSGVIR